jgi:hypothetical protein
VRAIRKESRRILPVLIGFFVSARMREALYVRTTRTELLERGGGWKGGGERERGRGRNTFTVFVDEYTDEN